MDSNGSSDRLILLFVVVAIFALLGGYLFYANKKMYDAGIHQALNKKAKNRK